MVSVELIIRDVIIPITLCMFQRRMTCAVVLPYFPAILVRISLENILMNLKYTIDRSLYQHFCQNNACDRPPQGRDQRSRKRPFSLSYIVAYGFSAKTPVYESFIKGAKDGLKTVVEITPTLIGLMVAVGVLRASGFLEFLGGLIAE